MDYTKLDPSELRIAVAERLGITRVEPYDSAVCDIEMIGRFHGRKNGESVLVPDFPNDLNACHEFEKTLDDGVCWHGYLNALWSVVCPELNQMLGLNAAIGLRLVHATATQRCVAFLMATRSA